MDLIRGLAICGEFSGGKLLDQDGWMNLNTGTRKNHNKSPIWIIRAILIDLI